VQTSHFFLLVVPADQERFSEVCDSFFLPQTGMGLTRPKPPCPRKIELTSTVFGILEILVRFNLSINIIPSLRNLHAQYYNLCNHDLRIIIPTRFFLWLECN
jgi:hypothetical protein